MHTGTRKEPDGAHTCRQLDASGAALALWNGAEDEAAPVRCPAGVAPDGQGVVVTDFFGSGLTRVRCR